MLKDVVKHGTAMRALALKRPDIAGKTGTTNDSIDAWFAGYHPKLVGVAWIGFDKPRNLGSRETGGGLALPIWISYMQKALQGVSVQERAMPSGVTTYAGDYVYTEYADGSGVSSVGLTPSGDANGPGDKKEDEPQSEIF
jgi:penicillin-binding protein 1A